MSTVQMRAKPIRLYWSGGRRDHVNYGDGLSRLIVERLSGRQLEYASPSMADLAAAGSILQNICKHQWKRPLKGRFNRLLVWGSGSMGPDRLFNGTFMDVRAVRGPATREAAGLAVGITLGDPGLLASMLIDRERPAPKFRFGLVPHLVDRGHPAIERMADEAPRTRIIDLTDRDITRVTREIASCEAILSSSLHGLIVADAFGILNARLKLSDNILGGDWKYDDYFASVRRPPDNPISAEALVDPDRLEARLIAADRERVEALKAGLLERFDEMDLPR